MNYNRLLVLFFFLALLLLCGQCSSDKALQEDKKSSTLPKTPFSLPLGGDTLSYRQIKLVESENKKAVNSSGELTRIILQYPIVDSIENPTLSDSIKLIINELLLADEAGNIAYKTTEERLFDFLQSYQKAVQEMKKDLVPISKWEYKVAIEVLTNTNRIVSLRYSEYSFMGGAHPNTLRLFFNFETKTGRLLSLEDIFTANYQPLLLGAGEAYFRRSVGLNSDTPLNTTAYEFPNARFALPRNFAITATGLLFCYNPYDIGPYALGLIEFEIPFDAILPILKKELLI